MSNETRKTSMSDDDKKFPLPIYDKGDDIYAKAKEEALDEGEDVDAVEGNDLDVPGAELDNADEKIGEEDEENNYYSIGGDNHNDLEEEKE